MTYAIIIPTRNRSAPLRQMLASLYCELPSQGVDVCVVDDGSDDRHAFEIQSICKHFGARLIRHAACRKMAVARNTGVAATQGDWIVFLDDDVIVAAGWYHALRSHIEKHALDSTFVGLEGAVACSGSGIWDAEVQNLSGGSYITCHMIYRRSVFIAVGGFDPSFEHLGPFAEDHEIAARMLTQGSIFFTKQVLVTHQPRRISLLSYLILSARRMQETLLAEGYFYYRQPSHYHKFRRHRTFWGTYAAICCKYGVTTFKRRTLFSLSRHPLQTVTLLFATLIEQGTAMVLFPLLLKRASGWRKSQVPVINVAQTGKIWGITPEKTHEVLAAPIRPFASIFFPVCRKPAVDYTRTLKKIALSSGLERTHFLIRVDDCFAQMLNSVRELARLFLERNIPWCMAITAADLHSTEYLDFIASCATQKSLNKPQLVCFGLHGFAHKGTYGPYASEILQLTDVNFIAQCRQAQEVLEQRNLNAPVFIAPFNSIDYRQVNLLASHFKVITGGPETLRFSGRTGMLSALANGAWYLPSLPPLYGRASEIIHAACVKKQYPGIHCITLHCDHEAQNHFSAVTHLLDALKENVAPWEILWSSGF